MKTCKIRKGISPFWRVAAAGMAVIGMLSFHVCAVQADDRFGHSIPGGDLEDVIARAQAMTPPADGKWIEIDGKVTAQAMEPTPAHFPLLYPKTQKGVEDAFGNTAKDNVTWTASNGVTLTFTDHSALIAAKDPHAAGEDSIYYGDGAAYIYSRNWYSNRYEPNTPEWWACKELEYNIQGMGYRVLENSGAFVIHPPEVATVDSFQTEISIDETYKKYREKMGFYAQYRELGTFYLSGHYDGKVGPAVSFASFAANEVQVITHHRSTLESCRILQIDAAADSPEKRGYHYVVRFVNNPDPLDWNILYNTLKRITPDAEAVYQEIYKQAYSDNPTFPDWNQWVKVGNETCVAAALNRFTTDLMFFIKDKDLNPGDDGRKLAEHSSAMDVRYERFGWNVD